MGNGDDQFLQVAETLASVKDSELAELAYPILESWEPQIGLLGGNKLERIGAWLSGNLLAANERAEKTGRGLIQILNEDRTRGDIALAAIVAAHLTKTFNIESVPVEEVVALSLLILRLYEPPGS